MKFSEAFFSTDKMLDPIISSIIFGAFLLIITVIFNNEIEDIALQIFMGIGFLIGNYIKSKNFIEEENKQSKNNKKKEKG